MPKSQIIFKGELTEVDMVHKVAYGFAYVCKKGGKTVVDHSGQEWPIEEVEKTDGGIIVPVVGREKPAEGIVIAVGPGKWIDGELQRPSISVGERVVFGKFSGAEVKLGFEKYLVLREEDLFLVRES